MQSVNDVLSDVESEYYYVAVLHYVFLAFGSYKALFFGSIISSVSDEIIVSYDFCSDESSFEV